MTQPERTADLTAKALVYMRDCMAMPNALLDQEQNWILGHLVTFAIRVTSANAKRRAGSEAPTP